MRFETISMKNYYLQNFFCAFSIFLVLTGNAQPNHTISGYVKDKYSGETLIGAYILLESDPSIGTATNSYGFYSFTLPAGEYRIVYSYLGYQSVIEQVN